MRKSGRRKTSGRLKVKIRTNLTVCLPFHLFHPSLLLPKPKKKKKKKAKAKRPKATAGDGGMCSAPPWHCRHVTAVTLSRPLSPPSLSECAHRRKQRRRWHLDRSVCGQGESRS